MMLWNYRYQFCRKAALFIILCGGISDIVVNSACIWKEGTLQYCIHQFRSRGYQNMTFIDALPGKAWDNLKFDLKAEVIELTYHRCNFILDSGLYLLLPDGCFGSPIKMYTSADTATSADSKDSSWSRTSSGMSAGGSVKGTAYGVTVGVSGGYSEESKKEKQTSVEQKKMVIKGELRFERYQIDIQPGQKLQKDFQRRITEIAIHIYKDKFSTAVYFAEKLVAVYGTHYLTSVTTGALLTSDFIFSKKKMEEKGMTSKSTTISGGFSIGFGPFSIGAQHTQTDTTKTEDSSKDTSMNVSITNAAIGGPVFLNSYQWRMGMLDNQVVINKRGAYLHTIINTMTLPNIPEQIVIKTSELVRKAIAKYYNKNVHHGCMDPTSPNFNYTSNINNQTACYINGMDTFMTYKFGGLVTKMKGRDNMRNLITGKDLCQKGFDKMRMKSSTQDTDLYWCVHSKQRAEVNDQEGPWYGGIKNWSPKKEKCDFPFVGQVFVSPGLLGSTSKDTLEKKVCVTLDITGSRQNRKAFGGMFQNCTKACENKLTDKKCNERIYGVVNKTKAEGTFENGEYTCKKSDLKEDCRKECKACGRMEPVGNPYVSQGKKTRCPPSYIAKEIFSNIRDDSENQCNVFVCERDKDTKSKFDRSLLDAALPPFQEQPAQTDIIENQDEILQKWSEDLQLESEQIPVYVFVLIFLGTFFGTGGLVLILVFLITKFCCKK